MDWKQSTLHHVAYNISLDAFESEKSRLESLDVKIICLSDRVDVFTPVLLLCLNKESD